MQAPTDPISSLVATAEQVASVIPDVLTALLVLILGWLVARLFRRLAIKLLRRIGVDAIAERTGFEGFLVQGGVPFTTVTLLGGALYWIVIFLTFVALLNMLAVPAGTELIERILRFIPNVAVAVIVLIFGSVVARFVGSVTFTYLNNVGSSSATAIAAIARLAMLIFVAAIAVEQLALKSEILVSGFQIAFGAFCLALALAFGLGGREWAARILDKYWKI
jgi:hypothetical protein